ncbi:uncharacterized protein ACB058_001222 isoform 1-T2 [Synchiropus picturatus]
MEYHSGGSLPLLGRPRYCPGANANGGYLCETGHCCGESGCCTYYYELWWFWLLWTVLILFSCCCAYRHRRAKQRVQQQQRQREISLLAYHGANSFPSSMLDLSFLASLKLPSYEEVAAQPSTPPPPYSSVFTTPRYPQPPRTADPHLLTQHDPLLHHPMSDGPSSLSSDNSSSCSCDSCCPSSPCSSSLSVPLTYETDTSHASTPNDVAPLTLDSMETIAAVATRLEVNETRFAPADAPCMAAAAQEPETTDALNSHQTVTVAVVTRAASPQSLPCPGSDVVHHEPTSPMKQQLNLALAAGTCSPGTHPETTPSSTVITGSNDFTCSPTTTIQPIASPQTFSADSSTSIPKPEGLNLIRTFGIADLISSTSSSDDGRTLAVKDSSRHPSPSDQCQGPSTVPTTHTHTPDSAPPSSFLVRDSEPQPTTSTQTPDPVPPNLTTVPDHENTSALNFIQFPELDSTSAPVPGGSGLAPPSPSPSSGLPKQQCDAIDLCPTSDTVGSGASWHLSPSLELDLMSPLQTGAQIGTGASSTTTNLQTCTPATCPAITIECESAFTHSTPGILSPTSGSPCPASSSSLQAPALLLDPLTMLHQSDKGGLSSPHTSSLSPSPRATQSPPKQTLFSPCVDVFEPEPASWEEGEGDQADEDDEEDMGADESQYRHRRLTGDSGIEVCRCRVEEDEDEEEEDDAETMLKVKRAGVENNKGSFEIHDSVDCPARAPKTTGLAVTLCNSASTTKTSDDAGEVVIVMDTI